MKKRSGGSSSRPAGEGEFYSLRLFVSGTTPNSTRALMRVKTLCDELLEGRYELEVVDIYQRPELARDEQILAIPTLTRLRPTPRRHFIGDLDTLERFLVGADLREYQRRRGLA